MSEEEFASPTESPSNNAGEISDNTLPLEIQHFLAKVSSGLLSARTSGPPVRLGPQFSNMRMLVAFSGGPDSTALLSALETLGKDLNFSLQACHVNHHLRGDESQRDELFCREICQRLDTPLDVRHREGKLQGESQLRDQRYQLLVESANEHNCTVILTGHTFDDQVETFLFRLFRGCAPGGLRVMESSRPLSDQLLLWRPLLSVTRASCLSYLQSREIPWVNDSTNDTIDYTRNYIRHLIMPVIEKRFPGFQKRLMQLRETIAGEDDYLNHVTMVKLAELTGSTGPNLWSLSDFQKEPLALQRRMVALAMQQRKIEVSFRRVEEILRLTGCAPENGALSLNQQWDIRVSSKFIAWRDKKITAPSTSFAPQTVRLPGLTILPGLGRALKIEVLNPDTAPDLTFPKSDAAEALVDLSLVKTPLVVRSRMPGDKIQPLGMTQSVHLKKYLHTHKPASFDEQTFQPLILLADSEEVLWIPGLGLSDRMRVVNRATHRLIWLKLSDDQANIC